MDKFNWIILKCIFIMAITEIVLNINASRICSENRIITLFNYIQVFKPGIVCIQEIDVRIASKVFKLRPVVGSFKK